MQFIYWIQKYSKNYYTWDTYWNTFLLNYKNTPKLCPVFSIFNPKSSWTNKSRHFVSTKQSTHTHTHKESLDRQWKANTLTLTPSLPSLPMPADPPELDTSSCLRPNFRSLGPHLSPFLPVSALPPFSNLLFYSPTSR